MIHIFVIGLTQSVLGFFPTLVIWTTKEYLYLLYIFVWGCLIGSHKRQHPFCTELHYKEGRLLSITDTFVGYNILIIGLNP